MVPTGKHCLLELQGCPYEKLNDAALIETTIKTAVMLANTTLIEFTLHQFQPCGVTALALLAESHISIHTWPEDGYAAVDAFTCGLNVKPESACMHIAEQLNAADYQIKTLSRGAVTSLIPESAVSINLPSYP